jgi:hypothetical protein
LRYEKQGKQFFSHEYDMMSLLMRYLVLLLLLASPCLALLNHYFKMFKTDVIGHNIVHIECGEGRLMNYTAREIRDEHLYDVSSSLHSGYSKACDINELAALCNANSNCSGFNSNGFLKSCTGGCDLSCCYDVTNGVDLYIRKGYLPPSDWQEKIDHGRMLFASPEPHFCFLAEIANGYLGTVSMSASLFQSGLFNGKVKNSNALLRLFTTRSLFLCVHLSVETSGKLDYRRPSVAR